MEHISAIIVIDIVIQNSGIDDMLPNCKELASFFGRQNINIM